MLLKLVSAVTISLVSTWALAGGIQDLQSFSKNTRALAGGFDQSTTTSAMQTINSQQGVFIFKSPASFRWDVRHPFEQLVVSDGRELSQYDADLAQVTVRPISSEMGASFFSILLDQTKLNAHFDVTEIQINDPEPLAWVQLTAKTDNMPFNRMVIGFKNGLPVKLMLTDSFEQVTLITLKDLEINPTLKPESFILVPPSGVTVLRME